MNNLCWPLINQRICDIYGLDPKQVRHVIIEMSPSEIPTVSVFLMTNEGLAHVLLDVLNGNVGVTQRIVGNEND